MSKIKLRISTNLAFKINVNTYSLAHLNSLESRWFGENAAFLAFIIHRDFKKCEAVCLEFMRYAVSMNRRSAVYIYNFNKKCALATLEFKKLTDREKILVQFDSIKIVLLF